MYRTQNEDASCSDSLENKRRTSEAARYCTDTGGNHGYQPMRFSDIRQGTGRLVHRRFAVQEALDGKVAEWMEKVSDEQYLAGPQFR